MAIENRSIGKSFPALVALGLTKTQFEDLAKQGTLSKERSRSATGCFKLRFRSGGKQVVRYIRRNAEFLDQVRREVAELQRPVKERRKTQHLIGDVMSQLRSVKRRLDPLLPLAGYRFRGREIRRQTKGRQEGRMDVEEVSEIYFRSAVMDELNVGSRVNEQLPDGVVATVVRTREKRKALFDALRSEALETPNLIQAAFRFEGALALEIESLLGERIVNLLRSESADQMPADDTISLIGVKAIVHRQVVQYIQMDRDESEARPNWTSPQSIASSQPEK